jgi:hypothetical protein
VVNTSIAAAASGLARAAQTRNELDTTPFRDPYGPNAVQITPQAAE